MSDGSRGCDRTPGMSTAYQYTSRLNPKVWELQKRPPIQLSERTDGKTPRLRKNARVLCVCASPWLRDGEVFGDASWRDQCGRDKLILL